MIYTEVRVCPIFIPKNFNESKKIVLISALNTLLKMLNTLVKLGTKPVNVSLCPVVANWLSFFLYHLDPSS